MAAVSWFPRVVVGLHFTVIALTCAGFGPLAAFGFGLALFAHEQYGVVAVVLRRWLDQYGCAQFGHCFKIQRSGCFSAPSHGSVAHKRAVFPRCADEFGTGREAVFMPFGYSFANVRK